VLACPFGVPKMKTDFKLMMKCDMCYDRTSVGKRPMCATVCPSQALFYGTREQVEALRPRSLPTNRFQFGRQTITTKVNMMVPRVARVEYIDVTAALSEQAIGKEITFNVLADDALMSAVYVEEGD
jgi:Fe-S-cluster-containing dehydrogenase component